MELFFKRIVVSLLSSDLDIDSIDAEATHSSTTGQNGHTTQASSSSDHLNELDSLLSYNLHIVPEGKHY